MTRALRLFLVATTGALSSACSTVPAPPQASKASFDVDASRMEAIERAAVRTGVRVIWVNPPQARAERGS